MNVSDAQFSKGFVGVGTNNNEGSRFDNLQIIALPCVEQVKQGFNFYAPHSCNRFHETFYGILQDSWVFIDPKFSLMGPSRWTVLKDESGAQTLQQNTLVYSDIDPQKFETFNELSDLKESNPSLALLNTTKTCSDGVISFMFKVIDSPQNDKQDFADSIFVGLTFKYLDHSNQFRLDISKKQCSLISILGNRQKTLASAPCTYKSDIFYHVRMVIANDQLYTVLMKSDSEIKFKQVLSFKCLFNDFRGQIGVHTFKTKAQFKNIRMAPLIDYEDHILKKTLDVENIKISMKVPFLKQNGDCESDDEIDQDHKNNTDIQSIDPNLDEFNEKWSQEVRLGQEPGKSPKTLSQIKEYQRTYWDKAEEICRQRHEIDMKNGDDKQPQKYQQIEKNDDPNNKDKYSKSDANDDSKSESDDDSKSESDDDSKSESDDALDEKYKLHQLQQEKDYECFQSGEKTYKQRWCYNKFEEEQRESCVENMCSVCCSQHCAKRCKNAPLENFKFSNKFDEEKMKEDLFKSCDKEHGYKMKTIKCQLDFCLLYCSQLSFIDDNPYINKQTDDQCFKACESYVRY